MATLLSTINRLLVRLREDSVTATTDTDYSILVGEFVADAYEEVCDAHQWEALRHVVIVDLVADQDTYDLTRTVASSGDVRNGVGVAKDDSELQWLDSNVPEIYLFDTDNDIDSEGFIWTTREVIRRLKNSDRTDTDATPTYVSIYPEVDSAGTTRLYMQLYPIPSEVKVVELAFWTKPATLLTTGADDTTVIRAPDRPIYHLALMYALNERGEEMGEPGNIAEGRYINSLGVAIEKDLNGPQRGNRYEWRRD